MGAKASGPGRDSTRDRVLRSLFEASPMSCRDVIKRIGLSRGKVYACLALIVAEPLICDI
jgi:transposase